ncbi:MAG: SDR family oxidoreductase [Candidatus Ancillula sp.]|jgi:nucleoside-diphosphate-sugar epimerase|nr:SDR family oxidoreductase [Candidatus Ancillula sp.]
MKILITGNMGYVGPAVIKRLREEYSPKAELIGLDTGYFAHSLTDSLVLPETLLNQQIFADVRDIDQDFLVDNDLTDLDAVVWLAAISNDVMGELNPDLTKQINYLSAVNLAKLLKENAQKLNKQVSFTFASSCSVYGDGSGSGFDKDGNKLPVDENSEVNPLTAYAKSKRETEIALEPLADSTLKVTCLRFATACGMSDRLRLDLMLNDFAAGAVTEKEITVLSDGSPWRPIIATEDMAGGVAYAIQRSNLDEKGGDYLVVNIGSNDWNYQVKDFANMCGEAVDRTKVSINSAAEPDKRSYRVNFDKFTSLADKKYLPQETLQTAVEKLRDGIQNTPTIDTNYRTSKYMRINTLKGHIKEGRIDQNLRWIR